MSLFDDFNRTLVGGAGNLISSYNYLNESTLPAAAAIRGKIDECLERYPVEAALLVCHILPYNLREFLLATAEAELSLKQDLRWRRLNDLTIGH